MAADTSKILRAHGLKKTPVRQSVLSVLMGSDSALSQNEIEQQLDFSENRVTVYRVLKDLENVGVIHRIVNMNGTVLFASCSDHCPTTHHQDEHIHFTCDSCHKVYCIEGLSVPALNFPQGFKVTSLNLSASGICDKCRQAL